MTREMEEAEVEAEREINARMEEEEEMAEAMLHEAWMDWEGGGGGNREEIHGGDRGNTQTEVQHTGDATEDEDDEESKDEDDEEK